MSKNFYQYFERTIQAGDIAEINTFADFFYLIDNSSAVDVQISLDNQAFQTYPEGLSIRLIRETGQNTSIVRLKNVDSSAVTVKFALANGDITQNNTQISGTINADDTATDINSDSAVTATTGGVTITADSAQKELVLYNNSSTITAWWGDSSVDPATNVGIPILPGEYAVIKTNSAVVLKTASSTAVISVNRLRKP